MTEIRKVDTAREIQAFLDFPRTLYAKDPNWVCPLDIEIRNLLFNRAKNPSFRDGNARAFVAYRKGRAVGRIAAFFQRKRAMKFEQPTGGVGFFECIDDDEVAFALFDAAQNQLRAWGMEAMDGPVNFGENDRHTGLLVSGFSQTAYGMPYNPPYYLRFFEKYGFEVFFCQSSKELDLTRPAPERFVRITRYAQEKYKVSVRYATRDKLEQFGEYFREIYNEAWRFHQHFVPIERDQMRGILAELKLILIEEMTIFGFVNGEPAGFLICLPDLNQIIKPFRGKLSWWEALLFFWRRRNKFEWYRKRGILNRGRVMIMGVKPKFQKHGVESAMAILPMDDCRRLGFKTIELSWVGDFNPAMKAVMDATGATEVREHRTFRYIFDPQKRAAAQRARAIAMDHRTQAHDF
ncbi:MAG: GNAT family N-acetyltransferase [Bacteroidia bacterium]|nr:GNAT family N-acetyltransferase [Bacteroidia bacterium]